MRFLWLDNYKYLFKNKPINCIWSNKSPGTCKWRRKRNINSPWAEIKLNPLNKSPAVLVLLNPVLVRKHGTIHLWILYLWSFLPVQVCMERNNFIASLSNWQSPGPILYKVNTVHTSYRNISKGKCFPKVSIFKILKHVLMYVFTRVSFSVI